MIRALVEADARFIVLGFNMQMTMNESSILGLIAEGSEQSQELLKGLRPSLLPVAYVLLGETTDDPEVQRVADAFKKITQKQK